MPHYPQMYPTRQLLYSAPIADIPATVEAEWRRAETISIGLGSRVQAGSSYAHGAWGVRTLIPEVSRAKMALAPLRLGLALLEDGYDQTCQIIGLRAEEISDREPELLIRAKE